MKKLFTFTSNFLKSNILFIGFLFIASLYVFSQSPEIKRGDRDVIPGYSGWAGDPDTITVNIDDSSFTDAEKDSIRVAINRWNEAGCLPVLKEVDDPPANINIVESDTLSDGVAGLYVWNEDGNGDVTSGTIYVNDDTSPLSLKEVVTHELGHALGLDDTDEAANPSDVMKGTGPTNGSDGNLSAHDSTELTAAVISALITIPGFPFDWFWAIAPPMAILPGEFTVLDFDLGTAFPPDVVEQTIIMVDPVGDPYLFVETAYIEDNLLHVAVFSEKEHGSGKLYLNIELDFPEPFEDMHFWGVHYINMLPAEPVDFDCPFNFNEDDGLVHINWVESCTYPLEHPLRAELVVDGTTHYAQRGGGDYTLTLEPGTHFVELYVDDYQINHAYYSQTILVTGTNEINNENTDYVIYPNPFDATCYFSYPENTKVEIYDTSGNLLTILQKGQKKWTPAPEMAAGVYFVRFTGPKGVRTMKIVYR